MVQWNFTVISVFYAAGLAWIYMLLIVVDVRALPAINVPPPHPKGSLAEEKFLLQQSSSSTLHKIIRQHDLHAQPARTGASNLHEIIQRLRQFTRNRQQQNNFKHTNIHNNNRSNSVSIANSTRLKRQLEGIFHVRGESPSSTVIPIVPSNETESTTFSLNSSQAQNGTNNRIKILKTTKKENRHTEDRKNPTTTTTTTKDFTDDDDNTDIRSPQLKDKRNFTVQIVEISRKTIIKHDNNGGNTSDADVDKSNNSHLPQSPQTDFENTKKVIDSKASLQKENFLKPTPLIFQPGRRVRPRLTFKNFRQPSQLRISDDSKSSSSSSSASKNLGAQNTPKSIITTSTTEVPKSVRDNKKKDSSQSALRKTSNNNNTRIEANVNYQEQIPYNDRDVDEADLKDYLEGHSTFGSKGDFKHTISRNVSGFLPNHGPPTRSPSASQAKTSNQFKKRGHDDRHHEVYKRTPTPPTVRRPRSRGGQRVNIEQATVRQMVQYPKTAIYTASGVSINDPVSQQEEEKSVFEYSGNRNKPQIRNNKIPKSTSAFEELYRQGHPAVLKAPNPIYKSHPLAEPYGTAQPEDQDHDNPFRADPLRDEPPLKFDPESDRFYGEPTPEKDKRLAQSNRPEPVRVENQTPEYEDQELDRRSTSSRPTANNNNYDNDDETSRSTTRPRGRDNNNDDNKYYYERAYEPKDNDYYDLNSNEGNPSSDAYIRDFVSLDDNFDRLPRPSADDENFRSLVPAEADDEADNRYFEPDRRKNNNIDNNRDIERQENDDTTTRRNSERKSSRPSSSRRQSNEDDYATDDGFDDSDDDHGGGNGSPEDFDSSYVDALKQFDQEIQRIEEDDRRGVTTGNPPTTVTREPPLVITSPGPAVGYPTGRTSAQRPTPATTPVHQNQDDDEEEETEQPDNRDDNRDRDSTTHRSQQDNKNNNDDEEESEEEEEEEEPEEAEVSSSTAKSDKEQEEDDNKAGDKSKDADESRNEELGIKVSKVRKETSSDKPKEDKSGNLDEDITEIEKEFRRSGKI